MASESVKRILDAEAEADRKTADARKRAEEIITEAKQNGVVAVQKKVAEAKAESEKRKRSDQERLKKYAENAEKECGERLDELRDQLSKNSDKAVSAIISGFFG